MADAQEMMVKAQLASKIGEMPTPLHRLGE